jgi:hypothetical protein
VRGGSHALYTITLVSPSDIVIASSYAELTKVMLLFMILIS